MIDALKLGFYWPFVFKNKSRMIEMANLLNNRIMPTTSQRLKGFLLNRQINSDFRAETDIKRLMQFAWPEISPLLNY